MKKFISVVMAALMAVSLCALAACDDDKDKAPVKYTVTYDANGGEGTAPAAESYEEGATVTVKPATTFTRDGYAFTKWNDGTADIAAGATFKMPAKNVTLKAQWEEVIPQLEGVWYGEMEKPLDGYGMQTAFFKYSIVEGNVLKTEGAEDEPHDLTVVALMGQPLEGRDLELGMCATMDEVEDAPGTYTGSMYNFVWDEEEKTLTLKIPDDSDEGEGEDEEEMKYIDLPLKYSPQIKSAPEFDGTYYNVYHSYYSGECDELVVEDDTVTITEMSVNASEPKTDPRTETSHIIGYVGEYAIVTDQYAPFHDVMRRTGEGIAYISGQGAGPTVYVTKNPGSHTVTLQYDGETIGEPIELMEGCSLGNFMSDAEDEIKETLGAAAEGKQIDWYKGEERYEYYFLPEEDIVLTARLVTALPHIKFQTPYTDPYADKTFIEASGDTYFTSGYYYANGGMFMPFHDGVNRIDIVRTFFTLEADGTYTLTFPTLDKFDWKIHEDYTFGGWELKSGTGGTGGPSTFYQPGAKLTGLTSADSYTFYAVATPKSAAKGS